MLKQAERFERFDPLNLLLLLLVLFLKLLKVFPYRHLLQSIIDVIDLEWKISQKKTTWKEKIHYCCHFKWKHEKPHCSYTWVMKKHFKNEKKNVAEKNEIWSNTLSYTSPLLWETIGFLSNQFFVENLFHKQRFFYCSEFQNRRENVGKRT